MPRKPKYRKPYPPEFRREAVALYARTDKTLGEIAADLGVSRESLRLWVQQAQIDTCLTKPVRQSQLFDRIMEALARDSMPDAPTTSTSCRAAGAAGAAGVVAAPLAAVRVLLAEDNEVNQEVARELLETAGLSTGMGLGAARNGNFASNRGNGRGARYQGY